MTLRSLDTFARAHHGLVSRQAAAAAGMSSSAWHRHIRSGRLIAVRPNVARFPGTPTTRDQAILAVILSLRHGAQPPRVVMASHRSAAYLLGLDRPFTDPIDVIVDRSCQRRLDGAIIHRPTDRIDLAPTVRHGIATTNELRTLVDLGAVDADAVTAALDLFTVRRQLTPGTLSALLARHGRRGRAGVTALRHAVEAWPFADDIPDSELEIAMARLLIDAGLPPARFHARIEGFEVDFLIEGTPIVIECDGWEYHVADRTGWEHDLDRDAILGAAGYITLRRTRRQILFDAEDTAELIRALVIRWATPRIA